MRSLSQFQALQEGEQELVSLRELGLTDAEIQLWLKRDAPEQEEKVRGVVEGACLITRSDKYRRYKFISTVAEDIYIPADTGQLPVQSCAVDVSVWFVLNRFLNVCVRSRRVSAPPRV